MDERRAVPKAPRPLPLADRALRLASTQRCIGAGQLVASFAFLPIRWAAPGAPVGCDGESDLRIHDRLRSVLNAWGLKAMAGSIGQD